MPRATDTVDTLLQILRALEPFDNSSTATRLRREIQKKLAILEARQRPQQQQAADLHEADPNVFRSTKLKKYHHYIRLIHDNYPEIPYGEIRRLFKARKLGNEVSIPDVVWQNPSP
jgi:hypothetical protein